MRRSVRLRRHFQAKASLAATGKRRMCPWALASREHFERSLGGELRAAHGEPQAITGHRIDESSGVSGEQQAGHARSPYVDREGPEHHWRRHDAGASEALAQFLVAIDSGAERPFRITPDVGQGWRAIRQSKHWSTHRPAAPRRGTRRFECAFRRAIEPMCRSTPSKYAPMAQRRGFTG